ncbi:MAG: 1-deoxy-D-xylulose-5-phosphate synthase, partial [Ignavibacteriaceae bacterium]|nr:1-deoxy-D-xylulose-5-phosphate synthase [Ignavibacteriaceae bacterium]
TVAMHKVFNTPEDRIIWDTGHQAYPHKILTGRKDLLPTIRQLNGISGFLKRNESEYDVFGAGHASTSVSAALGIAEANKYNETDRKVIAVIGDGAMTGGMAYEAMNNAGMLHPNLIVVLNDNNMSIAENVWQFSNYFTSLITSRDYNKFKGYVWEITGKMDNFGDRLRRAVGRVEGGLKSIVTPGMLFEALGFRYFGPINGHNLHQLIKVFEAAKTLTGPILIHTNTIKGKGYSPAEKNSPKFHGITPFDKVTGVVYKKTGAPPSYTSIFGETLTEIVKKDRKVVGITAAMPEGTGLNILHRECPNNFYDVGIAEEHAVTFAAGLATQGITPVVAIYSTFLQRAIDQIVHDIAIQKLHVVFAIDRAGLVGADGPTHHGVLDLTYLRMVPGMVIMAPKDENELRNMLFTAIELKDRPVAIRYPRGNALGVPLSEKFEQYEIGKAEELEEGTDVAILAVGSMVNNAQKALPILQNDEISAKLVNMRFVKPLDTDLLDKIAITHKRIVTIEENSIQGGFGSAVADYFVDKLYKNDILRIALPDKFVEHGTQAELHKLLEMDAEGIAARIKKFVHADDSVEKVVI